MRKNKYINFYISNTYDSTLNVNKFKKDSMKYVFNFIADFINYLDINCPKLDKIIFNAARHVMQSMPNSRSMNF